MTRTTVTTPITGALVAGAAELEQAPGGGVRVHRLPAWARRQTDDPRLAMAESQPAGVRIAVETAATSVALVVHPTRYGFAGLPRRPLGAFDLVVDGELAGTATAPDATLVLMDPATGGADVHPGHPSTVRFDGLAAGDKRIELWLPHNETVELHALHTDAPVRPAVPAARTWVHHGSSISQGSDALRPALTWPAIVARRTGVGLVNLGLSGSSLLDPFVARTIRDQPADAISLELGINLVNADLMRLRALAPAVHGFLDTIRDGHPDAPLLVVSPLLCPIHERTPGPGAFDVEALQEGRLAYAATGTPAPDRLTLEVVREVLAEVVAGRDDQQLRYLDGRELYGEADHAAHPLPDRLHPDAATHELIAERFPTP